MTTTTTTSGPETFAVARAYVVVAILLAILLSYRLDISEWIGRSIGVLVIPAIIAALIKRKNGWRSAGRWFFWGTLIWAALANAAR